MYAIRSYYDVDPGHDYWHVKRVVNNALTICKREGGDELVIHIAALLHDTADAKFFDEQTALNEILLFLQSLDWDTNRSMHVIEIITHLSVITSYSIHYTKLYDSKTLF